MKYYPLEKIYHMNKDIETEYNNRFNSPASFITNLTISPFIKGKKLNKKFNLFIFNSLELINITEKIYLNSNKIISKQSLLPKTAREKFLNLLLINELQSTNEIESVNSSKKEITRALNLAKNEQQKPNIKRFLGLVKLYSLINKNNHLTTINDFRKIYDTLVGEEISTDNLLDGNLFRKKLVHIYSGNNIVHHGLGSEDEIITELTNLLLFLKKEEIPTIYKALISHFYFEYIHPFYDGNGRVGRFLLSDLLAKSIDEYSAITFSYSINRNKNKYYKTFINASNPFNRGEITFFVKENLEILEQGQKYILNFLKENTTKLTAAAKYLEKNIADSTLKNILYILSQSYLFSAKDDLITHNELSEILKISPKTLNKYIAANPDKIVIVKKKPKIYTLTENYSSELFSELN